MRSAHAVAVAADKLTTTVFTAAHQERVHRTRVFLINNHNNYNNKRKVCACFEAAKVKAIRGAWAMPHGQ